MTKTIQFRSHGDQSDPPLLEDNEMLEAVRRKEIGSNEEEEKEIMKSISSKDNAEKVENREENHFEEAENTDENASNDKVSYFINGFGDIHFVMHACQICTNVKSCKPCSPMI